MNGKTVFERMTGVSDKFLEEAAFIPQAGKILAPPRRCTRENWLTRFANSGWGVACICFVVAIAAVVGMVAWGRMGDMTEPGGTSSARFTFSYTLYDTEGEVHDGTAATGELFSVLTTVTNKGRPFRCVEWEYFAQAYFVLQGDETVMLTGTYAISDFATPIYKKVETGDEGLQRIFFTIPWDATPGVYDLVLSYEGERQVFSGALTVEETPLVFQTQYQEQTDVFEKGQRFSIFTSLHTADGSHVIGTDGLVQCETVTFIHRSEDGTEYRLLPESMEFYEPSSSRIFTFFIPTDAPSGSYDLYLEAPCYSETYVHDLTVVDPGKDIIVRVAEGAIRNAYGRSVDLSAYTAVVEPTEDGGCTVTFRIFIEGITGGDYYVVFLGKDGSVMSTVSTGSGGRLDPFVGVVTPEMIEDAMERLGVTDKALLELTVDTDRYLLLVYHEYDGDGHIVDYRTERVCREP